MPVEHISAVTFAVRDMARSIDFYRKCGFRLIHGGPDCDFTSLQAADAFVNLVHEGDFECRWWGRAIFRTSDVDEHHRRLCDAGLNPQTSPRDAPWGERYFHVIDPDGHELSFAELLPPK